MCDCPADYSATGASPFSQSNPGFAGRSAKSNASSAKSSVSVKKPRYQSEASSRRRFFWRTLYVERRAAAASALDVRIFEFESGSFYCLNIVDNATIQVHGGGRVDKNLQPVEVMNFIHDPWSVLKRHGIRESGTTAAYHTNAQSGRDRVLLSHDLFHFVHCGRAPSHRALTCRFE